MLNRFLKTEKSMSINWHWLISRLFLFLGLLFHYSFAYSHNLLTTKNIIIISCIIILALIASVLYFMRVFLSKFAIDFCLGFSINWLFSFKINYEDMVLVLVLISFLIVFLLCVFHFFWLWISIRKSDVRMSFLDWSLWLGFSFGCLLQDAGASLVKFNLLILACKTILRQKTMYCSVLVFLFYILSLYSLLVLCLDTSCQNNHNLTFFNSVIYETFGYTHKLYLMAILAYTGCELCSVFTHFYSADPILCWMNVICAPMLSYLLESIFFIFVLYLSYIELTLINAKYSLLMIIALLSYVPGIVTKFLCIVALLKLQFKISHCNEIHYGFVHKQRLHNIWAANGFRHFAVVLKYVWISKALNDFVFLYISLFHLSNSILLIITSIIIDSIFIRFFDQISRCLCPNSSGYSIIRPLQSSIITSTPQTHHYTEQLELLERFFSKFSIHGSSTFYSSIIIKHNNPTERNDESLISEQFKKNIYSFIVNNVLGNEAPYDTYILYYSGLDDEFGNWIFEDKSSLTLKNIIDCWDSAFKRFQTNPCNSRLLILLDTLNGYKWCTSLLKLRIRHNIAIQTVYIYKSQSNFNEHKDIDVYKHIGKFTNVWINNNIEIFDRNHEQLTEHSLIMPEPIKLIYSTTPSWSNFQLVYPSSKEFSKTWDSIFPKLFKPLRIVFSLIYRFILCEIVNHITDTTTNTNTTNNKNNKTYPIQSSQRKFITTIFKPFWSIYYSVQFYHRKRYYDYYSPKFYSTGHGFYLIRS